MVFATSPTAGYSQKVPQWGLIWLLAAVLVVGTLTAAEAVWRYLGYYPSVEDSPALWRYWYEHTVVGDASRSIVITGSSRIQAGLSADEMHSRLPHYRIAQLGVYSGGSPIGILRKLAVEEQFNGIVICDALEPFLMKSRWPDQRHMYDGTSGPMDQLEAVLSATVNQCSALKNERTGLRPAMERLVVQHQLPERDYFRMHADRTVELHYEHFSKLAEHKIRSLAKFRYLYSQQPNISPVDADAGYGEICDLVRQIQARGGQVVFLRMPSSDGRLALENEYHPKADYWDRFSAKCSGICIHFTELENTRELKCPDDSHLDHCDAIRFTNAIVDELISRRACKM